MHTTGPSLLFRRELVSLLLLGVLGCGSGDDGVGVPLHPVQGKVKVGDTPLTTGTVSFNPDADKGNVGDRIPLGEIDAEGSYVLYTAGEAGAPAGWYKVTVIAQKPIDENAEGEAAYADPEWLVAESFTSPESTPLSIEVKPDAPEGHYDLSVEPR
jgi:hypothetical protein